MENVWFLLGCNFKNNRHLKNILKVIGIMYCAIFVKNVFQLVLGYFSNSPNDIKLYKLYNLSQSNYSYGFLIQLIVIYDFILFAISVYFPIYLILYLLINSGGNKIGLQISYMLIMYLVVNYFFNNGNCDILFVIITIVIGLLNWFLFKKWVNEK
ncbi:hypothetical protein D1631_12350 [Chryseobacterium nematophagum]|uniref:Uncharacterized protein n=1 Tax=Chryseobacterium nematophagum TaxID=2305228 RepID=A0A3M7TIE1_9FLAO|nr:hypothetical protein D1631_12350 [Chryseobacterium nematophagum]